MDASLAVASLTPSQVTAWSDRRESTASTLQIPERRYRQDDLVGGHVSIHAAKSVCGTSTVPEG